MFDTKRIICTVADALSGELSRQVNGEPDALGKADEMLRERDERIGVLEEALRARDVRAAEVEAQMTQALGIVAIAEGLESVVERADALAAQARVAVGEGELPSAHTLVVLEQRAESYMGVSKAFREELMVAVKQTRAQS